MHPFYRHIARVNQADLSQFTPLLIHGAAVGLVHQKVASSILKTPFVALKDSHLVLKPEQDDLDGRSTALRAILHHLIAEGLSRRERFETYSVATSYGAAPLALADRALMPLLGLPATGIHCNAFVRKADGIYLWTARRSPTSHVDPNKLDHLVAGGQPHGLTLHKNLAKEAWEEAAIPEEIAGQGVPAGCLRYARQDDHQLRRDTLFIFDLELPLSFQPRSNDGESLDFRLLHADEVKNLMLEEDTFKFNVPMVLVDFMIRHGLIDPEEPGYTALAHGLHQGTHI